VKLSVFNGSPRGQRSNTAILLNAFLEGLGKDSSEQFFIYGDKEEVLIESFDQSDTIIFAFPLYTDSVPGKLKYFLEHLKALDWRGKRIGVIVQSGFPEAVHSSFIAEYFQRRIEKKHAECIGTVIKGGVEGIQIQPSKWREKLTNSFGRLGEEFQRTGYFDEEIVRKLQKPWKLSPLRRFMYSMMSRIGIANFYWDSTLKKNNAYEHRFDKPYT